LSHKPQGTRLLRYDGTVRPLIAGFFLLSLASLQAMHWAEKKEQQPASRMMDETMRKEKPSR
ncbi:MAG: hypothetical protein WBP54_06095, partial [Pelodictyon phaeoclathratiforme]